MNSNLKKIMYGSRKNTIIKYLFLVILSVLTSCILGDILYFIIIFPVFLIIFALISITERKEINEFLKNLSSEQLIILNRELEHPLINCHNNYVLTEHYVLSLKYKIAFFKYSEILLMYKDIETLNDRVNEYLIVITKEDWYRFDISSTMLMLNCDLKDFSSVIRNKNPKVLEGNTEENRKQLKDKYNIEV